MVVVMMVYLLIKRCYVLSAVVMVCAWSYWSQCNSFKHEFLLIGLWIVLPALPPSGFMTSLQYSGFMLASAVHTTDQLDRLCTDQLDRLCTDQLACFCSFEVTLRPQAKNQLKLALFSIAGSSSNAWTFFN